MRDDKEDASEIARFMSREYVARVERELGKKLPDEVAKRERLTFETGYLRGRGDGMRAAMAMFDALKEVQP